MTSEESSTTVSRLLLGLNLEKHQTGRQLTRLLYPQDYNKDEKPYQRVMKSLKRMERDGLLKSKSYGLSIEKLWAIKKHKMTLELGYVPPKSEVHSLLYDHEKACADIFVSLALTDRLLGWEGEGDQKSGFRFDRKFWLTQVPTYLEVEMGTQGAVKLRAKLERYRAFTHREKEPFYVLFTVPNEAAVERLVMLFADLCMGNRYSVAVHSAFVSDPLNTPLTNINTTIFLSKSLSKH